MTDATDPSLATRFLAGLGTAPRNVALRVGSESVTYEHVHELALSWAAALRDAAAGERPGPVGVLADKSVQAYVGILAALYSGATVVPLHAAFPIERTRYMLDAAGVTAVVADAPGLGTLAQLGADLPVLAPGCDAGDGRLRRIHLPRGGGLDHPVAVRRSDVAYILFTSGSTGRPKGVPLTYGMIHHYFSLVDRRYDFTAADVFSQTFDLNFDCAMFDMFCAWGAGASVTAVPAQAYRDLPTFVTERRMTVWFSAPSAIALIRRMGGLAPGGMPGLRWSLFAGEVLREQDAVEWASVAADSTVENIYGPTELTLTVTVHRWSPERSPELCVNGIVPIGALHEGHDYLLLSREGKVTDREGELCVTGPQMTPGYLDPDDDEGRFLKHDGRRWYRTGDRVRRLPEDELIYLGRRDSQVQVQGWRIELAEIEHALRGCIGVEDAVTVTRSVNNITELCVFYTGEPVPPAQLATQLAEVLPQGMMPRQYIHLAEFPLNSNRKIDRLTLGHLAASAASGNVGPVGLK
jgi:amino acid adenylation domain-containing protein